MSYKSIKKLLPIILSTFSCSLSFAQEHYNITGYVSDEKGNPVCFANIYLDGTVILASKKVIVYLSASNVLNRKNIYGYRFSRQPDTDGMYRGQPVKLYHNQSLYVGVSITLGKNAAYEASYF